MGSGPGWPWQRLGAAGLVVLAWLLTAAPALAADPASLWAALRDGSAFAMIRHALAPGNGDPESFRLGDCSTQRNLSGDGRRQAAALGERFRANGIATARVFTSEWCRCRDTAERLGLGPVTALPPLNSLHRRPELVAPQVAALASWLGAQPDGGTLVLVTHHSNIRALVGVGPTSGGVVVARREADGRVIVLGSL
jgi:8-oxo-(d)GTP phosphatase